MLHKILNYTKQKNSKVKKILSKTESKSGLFSTDATLDSFYEKAQVTETSAIIKTNQNLYNTTISNLKCKQLKEVEKSVREGV